MAERTLEPDGGYVEDTDFWGETIGSVVGGVAGGIAGAATLNPFGVWAAATAGATAGALAGKGLEELYEKAVYGQDASAASEYVKLAATEAVISGVLFPVGGLAVKGVVGVADTLSKNFITNSIKGASEVVDTAYGAAKQGLKKAFVNSKTDIERVSALKKSADGYAAKLRKIANRNEGTIIKAMKEADKITDPAKKAAYLEGQLKTMDGDVWFTINRLSSYLKNNGIHLDDLPAAKRQQLIENTLDASSGKGITELSDNFFDNIVRSGKSYKPFVGRTAKSYDELVGTSPDAVFAKAKELNSSTSPASQKELQKLFNSVSKKTNTPVRDMRELRKAYGKDPRTLTDEEVSSSVGGLFDSVGRNVDDVIKASEETAKAKIKADQAGKLVKYSDRRLAKEHVKKDAIEKQIDEHAETLKAGAKGGFRGLVASSPSTLKSTDLTIHDEANAQDLEDYINSFKSAGEESSLSEQSPDDFNSGGSVINNTFLNKLKDNLSFTRGDNEFGLGLDHGKPTFDYSRPLAGGELSGHFNPEKEEVDIGWQLNFNKGGKALSNKISKIHGEGYDAPGQAFAIAKEMGYNCGGKAIKLNEGGSVNAEVVEDIIEGAQTPDTVYTHLPQGAYIVNAATTANPQFRKQLLEMGGTVIKKDFKPISPKHPQAVPAMVAIDEIMIKPSQARKHNDYLEAINGWGRKVKSSIGT